MDRQVRGQPRNRNDEIQQPTFGNDEVLAEQNASVIPPRYPLRAGTSRQLNGKA